MLVARSVVHAVTAVFAFGAVAGVQAGFFDWVLAVVAAAAYWCFVPAVAGWDFAAVVAVPFGRDSVAVCVATFPLLLKVAGRQKLLT